MIEGKLIMESLRVGTSLENLKLTVRAVSRYRAQGTTPDQPTAGTPSPSRSWTGRSEG